MEDDGLLIPWAQSSGGLSCVLHQHRLVTGPEPCCLGSLDKRKMQRVQRTESEGGRARRRGPRHTLHRSVIVTESRFRRSPAGALGAEPVLDDLTALGGL